MNYKLIAKHLKAMAEELENGKKYAAQEELLKSNPTEFFNRLKKIRASKGKSTGEKLGSFKDLYADYTKVAEELYSHYQEDVDEDPDSIDTDDQVSSLFINYSPANLYPEDLAFASWLENENASGITCLCFKNANDKYGWEYSYEPGDYSLFRLIGFSTIADLQVWKTKLNSYFEADEIQDLLDDIEEI